nr:ImmA/IrrE family metallo-endopeptidase [Sporosarcina jiandibaonis]
MHRIGVFDPPCLTIGNMISKIGIPVYYWEFTSEAIHKDGIHIIFLNRNATKEEQWQDYAHELCHIMYHAGNQSDMPNMFKDLQEWQAINFALHFCVPTFMLDCMYRRNIMPWHKKEASKVIAETFCVELRFAEIRLDKWLKKRQFHLLHQGVDQLLDIC